MRILALIPALLLATPAIAAPWNIQPGSTLSFTGSQSGDAFTGHFTRFTPVVEFDPAKPEAGKITVTVDMASATIDDKDKQDSLPTEDWFFTKQFPTATYTSSAIHAVAGKANHFISEGTLTLRGISQPVQLPFSLREESGLTHAEGGAVLARQEFGVGQGQWKDDKWVAFPVEVTFHLLAKPQ